ncbi:MAG: adenylate/guanylate cyclase domain-containing protein [Fidelibacterota bacterium]|nr:MAG: adenylate/guanylate cyclase domain-containing protein [Candidatus Neomarinimicrobiota bacterium]
MIHLGSTAADIFSRINGAILRSTEKSLQNISPFMTTAALLGVIGHPLFYVIWRAIFPQHYENLPLRLLGSLLCVPFLFRDRWPKNLVKYMPVYLHITVFYNLPFLFSFLLIKNHFSQVWVLSTIGAAFVLTFLIEWRAMIVLLGAGALFWGVYLLTVADTVGQAASIQYVVIILFPLIFGGIFSYQLQRYRDIQSRLEQRIRRISNQNARMMQEQNRLLSLFLSNTIVSRLQHFQKKFGFDNALSMITRQEKRFCGIMEADIRNFTRMFGHESELEVAQLISRCFTEITAIGQDLAVIKPVGDALFMYCDDEYGKENAVPNILALAVFFVHSLEKVNRVLAAQGKEPLNFGIAVHAGEAVYGNLASDTLIDPTIVGVDVNKTARLEELTKYSEVQDITGINAILISEEAVQLGQNFLSRRLLVPVDLKELQLTVRDFPDVSKVYALPSDATGLLHERAMEHIQAQRSQMPMTAGQMEANTYHGIPYYYEMQGVGPNTTWTIMIDLSSFPTHAFPDGALKTLASFEYEIRRGDGQWLIVTTEKYPGEYDESDVEARIVEIIQEVEQAVSLVPT